MNPAHVDLPIMQEVRSSNIASVGFKFATMDEGAIFIQFHSGTVWRYDRCSRAEYDGLLRATSTGVYFHDRIRSRKQGEQIVDGKRP